MSNDEKWITLPLMATEREGCAAVSYSGKLYVLGGKDNNWNNLSSCEVYDPLRKSWSSLPSMWTKRRGCAAVILGGQIYVMGGNDAHSVHSSCEMYDPMTGCWTEMPEMNKRRSNCAAVEINGCIYVMGGYDENYLDHSSVEVFDPSFQCWTLLQTPMTTGRSGCAAVKLGGRIYVLGGSNAQVNLASMEVFDPSKKTWKSNRSMNMQRYGCAAVGMAGNIYVIGGLVEEKEDVGNNRKILTSSMEKFTPSTKRWKSMASMGTERQGCAAVGIGERLYVVGGFTNPGTRLNSVESIYIEPNFPPSPRSQPKVVVTKNENNATAKSLPPSNHHIPIIPPPPPQPTQTKRSWKYKTSAATSASMPPRREPTPIIPQQRRFYLNLKSSTTKSSQKQQPLTAAATTTTAPVASELPQTMQLFQDKIPTADFVPVAAEVFHIEEATTLHPRPPQTALPTNLKKATTEEICTWLSKHGLSKTSLDILKREEIDGTFLFEESMDDLRIMLKEEGMKLGQISKIRSAIEEAKREEALI